MFKLVKICYIHSSVADMAALKKSHGAKSEKKRFRKI